MEFYHVLIFVVIFGVALGKKTECTVSALCQYSDSSMKAEFRPLPIKRKDSDFSHDPSESSEGGEWFDGDGGKKYLIMKAMTEYEDAVQVCAYHGTRLPVYAPKHSDAYNTLVNKLREHGEMHGFWIGLTDRAVEGDWRWSDNSMLREEEKKWDNNQPDDNNGQDCAYISRDKGYKWDDGDCSGLMYVLCESM